MLLAWAQKQDAREPANGISRHGVRLQPVSKIDREPKCLGEEASCSIVSKRRRGDDVSCVKRRKKAHGLAKH